MVVGVYIGYDEPQTLGKFETGAKTAMPIFKSFMKRAVKKENTRPFKIPEDITLMVVDSQTGKKVSFASKKTLIESFKSEKINQNFNPPKTQLVHQPKWFISEVSTSKILFATSRMCVHPSVRVSED